MANDGRRDGVRREVLPIPDKPPVRLTTYDAQDPDTRYPPIVPPRPPEGQQLRMAFTYDGGGSWSRDLS